LTLIIASLRQRIDQMSNWIDHLDDEIISCRRRLWLDYIKIFNIANIMDRIMAEFGEDGVQRIIDYYMRNEQQNALKKQRQLAKDSRLNVDFVDLDSLFATEN